MIVSKDEILKDSMPYVGSSILSVLKKQADLEISFLKLIEELHKQGISRYRPILFALSFLHSLGAIDFTAPNITLLTAKESS